MDKRTKQKIVCAALITLGLALIVGGIYIPPLLIPGVPMFVGGLGVAAAIVEDKDKIAFNTTINNIHNHECHEQHSGAPTPANTPTSPASTLASTPTSPMESVAPESNTASSTYNFSASARIRIDTWNAKLRDLFSNAPKEMSNEQGAVPPLMFSHNYHYPAHATQEKYEESAKKGPTFNNDKALTLDIDDILDCYKPKTLEIS